MHSYRPVALAYRAYSVYRISFVGRVSTAPPGFIELKTNTLEQNYRQYAAGQITTLGPDNGSGAPNWRAGRQ
ncbi:hypothetical protein KCP75_12745 [Salmonella enterica subsp. enterica]|nr:hypothetical protein KCP75_12745 [Salmonella enterica subsp. enterica]